MVRKSSLPLQNKKDLKTQPQATHSCIYTHTIYSPVRSIINGIIFAPWECLREERWFGMGECPYSPRITVARQVWLQCGGRWPGGLQTLGYPVSTALWDASEPLRRVFFSTDEVIFLSFEPGLHSGLAWPTVWGRIDVQLPRVGNWRLI